METDFSGIIVKALHEGGSHSDMVLWKNINTTECGRSDEDRLESKNQETTERTRVRHFPQ